MISQGSFLSQTPTAGFQNMFGAGAGLLFDLGLGAETVDSLHVIGPLAPSTCRSPSVPPCDCSCQGCDVGGTKCRDAHSKLQEPLS